jgi:hypothetical protein
MRVEVQLAFRVILFVFPEEHAPFRVILLPLGRITRGRAISRCGLARVRGAGGVGAGCGVGCGLLVIGFLDPGDGLIGS